MSRLNVTIKDNLRAYEQHMLYKKEHKLDIWRGTGRTIRDLFDLASRYPDGNFIYITHNRAMAQYAFHKFVDIMTTFGAPVTVNVSTSVVSLHDARYKFACDSKKLRQELHPDTVTIEDHMVGELGSKFKFPW